ncbi:hypothetical protein PVAND_013853 [Polypedilum vanderplanki]|uniref:Uncharacterized protein n=1 Tax=Polypedilum vanderplanki TaxID=319348 RepID=A0A9J6CRS0_POLVA|nr:hypothetical protein PVAND_013853 [Polypedilum vanderplanki]
MCNSKVDLEEINKLSKDELKEILKRWMDQKEITKDFQKKLRKQLFNDFHKTALGNAIKIEEQKKSFHPKKYVLNAIESEHLYCEKNFFTLSVFSTEIQSCPNFERNENFRFAAKEIQDYMEILGLTKNDVIVKQITSMYKTSNESLLTILLSKLISNHKCRESKSASTQTEEKAYEVIDPSQLYISKSTKILKGKNHSLINPHHHHEKEKRRKRSTISSSQKGVTLIAQNLDKMSHNISVITEKLEDFQRFGSSRHDDSNTIIISSIGGIMQQLNGCVNNFEKLCNDIKAVTEKQNRDYDEWMDELKNSNNGRKFLKKFSKSFDRILSEEKNKIQKDYKTRLEREKRKLSKFSQSTQIRGKRIDKKIESIKQPPAPILESQITKDIDEIYRNALQTMKNIEQENEIFEKSVEIDIMNKRKMREIEKLKLQPDNIIVIEAQKDEKKNKVKKKEAENDLSMKLKLDLNDRIISFCQ